MAQLADRHYMARAIRLAAHGHYSTFPNPAVGCVLVRDGRIIGEGWHEKAGEPHAEINALGSLAAGADASGATAYITLEPCSHDGRTPPCCDALIAARVARVVAASEDPNPQVAGEGLRRLAAAGIAVQTHVLEEEARALNPGFMALHELGRPFVRLKLAASLDGRTALANRVSRWITGDEARRDVHRLRAMSSAVVTGAGTVLSDNPSLTVRELPDREQLLKGRQPVRVVLDSRGRTPGDARVLDDRAPCLLVTAKGSPANWPGAEVITLAGTEAGLDLAEVLQQLAARELHTLMFECGPLLAGGLLRARLVDELIVYLAPRLLGHDARPLVQLGPFEAMEEVMDLPLNDVRQLGDDLRLTFRFRF